MSERSVSTPPRSQPTRVEGVKLLLEARGWHTPAPEGADAKRLRLGTRTGEAQFHKTACPDCQGTGQHRKAWTCLTCEGKGSYYVDAYTGARVVASYVADASDVPMQDVLARLPRVRCSACAGRDVQCARCNGVGSEPGLLGGKADLAGLGNRPRRVSHGDPQLDLLERQHDQLAHPAQQALTGALEELGRMNPGAVFAVTWTYVEEAEREETLLPASRLLVEWTIERLAAMMPAGFLAEHPPRMLLPAEVYAAWLNRRLMLPGRIALATANGKGRAGGGAARARRDREIRRLYASGGWSLRALGRRFDLSHPAVKAIVAGTEAAA